MTDASPRRIGIAMAVIAVHVILLALLLRSVVSVAPPPASAIEVANIAVPPPAPPPPPPPATRIGAPAKAPKPEPAPAAPPPVAPMVAAGPAAAAGDGSTGTAASAGGGGNGTGGGIVRARWTSGSISNRDYPKAAKAAGVGGAVTVHFDVRADGGVEHCRVVVSSGSALLDETTCRLIEARFRYTPARDASGADIADIAGWKQDWWLTPPR